MGVLDIVFVMGQLLHVKTESQYLQYRQYEGQRQVYC